jgi:hypothetical protein
MKSLRTVLHWYVGLLLLSNARFVHAQPLAPLWFAGGVAAGTGGPANSTGHDWQSGRSVYLGAGVVLSPRLLLGVDGTFWRSNGDLGTSRLTFVSATALGYPVGHLFLQAGLGFGSASLPSRVVTSDGSRLEVSRASLLGGIGYDFPVSCPVWLSPFFQSLNTLGPKRNPKIRDQEGSENGVLVQVGLALRFARPGHSSCTSRAP